MTPALRGLKEVFTLIYLWLAEVAWSSLGWAGATQCGFLYFLIFLGLAWAYSHDNINCTGR